MLYKCLKIVTLKHRSSLQAGNKFQHKCQ